MFVVRPAQAEDASYVYDIDVKSFDEPWTLEKWHTPAFSIAVATVQQTPVGMVVFEIKDEVAILHKIAVRPNFRLRGVSRQLMAEFVKASMYSGVQRIETIIPEYLALQLVPWLRKLGFYGEGVKPRAFQVLGEPEDGYIFKKDIK